MALQALQCGVLTADMLEHLTSEQSEWLLAHLAAASPKTADPAGSSSANNGSPVVAQTTSDQHEALTDFLVGATASGEQLSSQHYGCLAQHCKVVAARAGCSICDKGCVQLWCRTMAQGPSDYALLTDDP